MTTTYRKKLIEVALPLAAINEAAAREKSIRHGHPSTLHLWWARRPLAAARAVLFAQLVDDPSAWPELFPTEEAQEKERQRLFTIIEKMVPWEATNDEAIFDTARLEIARSWARSHPSEKASRILAGAAREVVNDYLATELPPVHDPFAGGGTIPLEAQRLGLRAIATDLNPVAVLINKALIEIPPKFPGLPPVNPESRQKAGLRTWKGAEGLAEDVRYYGAWMREEARKRIGHLYPDVEVTKETADGRPDLKGLIGQKLKVIAWLWARTVASPNPALGGAHVPLVSSYWLSTREGKATWLDPIIERDGRSYRFQIRKGTPKNEEEISAGTKLHGASFKCLLSDSPIEPDYIRAAGRAGKLGACLIAIVAETERSRVYLRATREHESVAAHAVPSWSPDELLPEKALGFRVQNYGISRWSDLFTSRQLTALSTFTDVAKEARALVSREACSVDPGGDATPLSDGGTGLHAYAEAVGLYLGLAVSKTADYSSALVLWSNSRDQAKTTFSRQALPMVWDFAEVNPLAAAAGDPLVSAEGIARALDGLPGRGAGEATQRDAAISVPALATIVSTDPPYFDNVPYADLSDFFYVWLRRTLREVFPDLLSTIGVPKASELIADPFRHGGKEGAEKFFLAGMTKAMRAIQSETAPGTPVTVYYAYKQSETTAAEETSSTGWETFLQAMADAGFAITGTWPVRSERSGRTRDIGSNALASSVVLVARARSDSAPAITRGEFRRELRVGLPAALRALRHGNIAPTDVAQASIGPGMAIFSRYAKVLEADGSTMTVRTALQLINEALYEAQEGDADSDTLFAIAWFESNGWTAGSYGDAENLARARNVSVAGIVEAGVIHSAAGKVRLLKRSEHLADWDPTQDSRLTVWEAAQHLIKRLEEQGEAATAALLKALGPLADHARDLSYRLYSTCERKGWAEDARAYNGLVIAWPELEKLAAAAPTVAAPAGQLGLGIGGGEEGGTKPRPGHGRRRRP